MRITDDDDPAVTVSFGAASYTAAEGGSVTVTVTLSEAPERSVTIPLTRSNQDGATDGDYSGVPANVTFGATETSKTFTFSATQDSVDDDDESVTSRLGFASGRCPQRDVSCGDAEHVDGADHGRRRPATQGDGELRGGEHVSRRPRGAA